MSALRQSSEWGMGRIKGLWSYLEFKVIGAFVFVVEIYIKS